MASHRHIHFFSTVARPRDPTGAGDSRALSPTRSPTTTPEQERRRRHNPLRRSAWARGRCTRRSSAAARTSTAIPPSTQASARPGACDASPSSTPPRCVSPSPLPLPIPRGASLAMFLTCSYILPVGREGLGHHLGPSRRHRRGNTRSPARSHAAARFVWSLRHRFRKIAANLCAICCPVCAVVLGWLRCRRFAQCCARV